MKMFLLVLCTYCLTQTASAQLYTEYFITGALDEGMNYFTPTATCNGGNGSVIMTGYVDYPGTNKTPFICKFNNGGGLDWIYEYPPNYEDDELVQIPIAITTTYPEGHIVVAGNLYPEDDHSLNQPANTPFILKVTPNGAHIFTRYFSCLSLFEDNPSDLMIEECHAMVVYDIVSDLSGGYTIAGSTKKEEDSNLTGFIMQFDNVGDVVYGNTELFSHPAYEMNEVLKIKYINDEYVLLLRHQVNTDPSLPHMIASVIKLNSAFSPIWSNMVIKNDEDFYIPYDMEVSHNTGDIYVLGQKDNHRYVSRLNSYGVINGTNRYSNNSYVNSGWFYRPPNMSMDNEDNLYISNTIDKTSPSKSLSMVLKVAADGDIVWNKIYGNEGGKTTMTDIAVIYDPTFAFPTQDLAMVGVFLPSIEPAAAWKVRARTNDGSTDCHHKSIECQKTFISSTASSYDPSTAFIPPFEAYYFQNVIKENPAYQLDKCNSSPFGFGDASDKGIDSFETFNNISVFPNPSQGRFTIKVFLKRHHRSLLKYRYLILRER